MSLVPTTFARRPMLYFVHQADVRTGWVCPACRPFSTALARLEAAAGAALNVRRVNVFGAQHLDELPARVDLTPTLLLHLPGAGTRRYPVNGAADAAAIATWYHRALRELRGR